MIPIMGSFFDTDKSTPFWSKQFISYKQTDLAICDHLLLQQAQGVKRRKLSIYPPYLVYHKKETIKWVNLVNVQMENIRSITAGQGIRLLKNKHQFQFYGDVEPWFNIMKQFTVQLHFFDHYVIVKKLGQGNFAEVYKVQLKSNNTKFAVKCFKKSLLNPQIDRPAIIKEISIQRKIQHEAVIRLYEVFESEECIYMVLEHLKGGELYKYLKKCNTLNEETTAKIIYKLIRAVNHIHENGIFHRDIKPENIILKKKGNVLDLCIADFGLADFYNPSGKYMFTRCGTPGYVAPEVLRDQLYDYKVDMFSLGILMYIMISGKNPFSADTYESVVSRNYNGTIDFDQIKLSQLGFDFLKGLLNRNPISRFSSEQALKHAWFRQEKVITVNIFKIRKQSKELKQCSSPTLHYVGSTSISSHSNSPQLKMKTSQGDDSPISAKLPTLTTARQFRKSNFHLKKY